MSGRQHFGVADDLSGKSGLSGGRNDEERRRSGDWDQ